MLRFHAIGQWRPGEVVCRWTESTFRPQAPALELIERAWAEAVSRPGVQLFDGPMCRMESFARREGVLELLLSRTSYKMFMGTNMRNSNLADRLGWAALANPVGVSCALVSADDFLLMGRRNERVAYYPGRIHPFAGALEPHDQLDIFQEVRRELGEELSLGPADIAEMHCMGMVEDLALRQPELICLVRSTRQREQIESQVDRTEHHASWSIAPEAQEVESALAAAESMTPVGVATTLLWGRSTFGVNWFERMRVQLGIGN